jgi:hypothetical protein
MIPNHAQFIAAIKEKKKVNVRFYSKPDSGVLDRVCAPIEYGPGSENKDGLNRYWLWDYASETGSHTIGLVPQQIVALQVLGEVFDPAQFIVGDSPVTGSPTGRLPHVEVVSTGGDTSPAL